MEIVFSKDAVICPFVFCRIPITPRKWVVTSKIWPATNIKMPSTKPLVPKQSLPKARRAELESAKALKK